MIEKSDIPYQTLRLFSRFESVQNIDGAVFRDMDIELTMLDQVRDSDHRPCLIEVSSSSIPYKRLLRLDLKRSRKGILEAIKKYCEYQGTEKLHLKWQYRTSYQGDRIVRNCVPNAEFKMKKWRDLNDGWKEYIQNTEEMFLNNQTKDAHKAIKWFLQKTWCAQAKIFKRGDQVVLPETRSHLEIVKVFVKELQTNNPDIPNYSRNIQGEWGHVETKLEHLINVNNKVRIEKGEKKADKLYKEYFELLGLKSLSYGKALSIDGIPDEVCHPEGKWRYWQQTYLWPRLRRWIRGEQPLSGAELNGRMMALSKTGSAIVQEGDIRPITMLSPIRKCAELIWLRENAGRLWAQVGDYQQGFRAGGSCHLQVRRLEYKILNGEYIGAIFIDIKGAYNKVDRLKLWSMFAQDFPQHETSVELLRNLLEPNELYFESIKFRCNAGVPQGAIISPVLFNYYLDKILREIVKRFKRSNGKYVLWDQVLAYADDLVFLFKTEEEGVAIVKELHKYLGEFGMKIGWNKSGIMCKNPAQAERVRIRVNDIFMDVNIPNVARGYKYLGVHFRWPTHLDGQQRIEEACKKVAKKVIKYQFRFGKLRNDFKQVLMTSYIEQEFAYRIFPLVIQPGQIRKAEKYFMSIFRQLNHIPKYVSSDTIRNSKSIRPIEAAWVEQNANLLKTWQKNCGHEQSHIEDFAQLICAVAAEFLQHDELVAEKFNKDLLYGGVLGCKKPDIYSTWHRRHRLFSSFYQEIIFCSNAGIKVFDKSTGKVKRLMFKDHRGEDQPLQPWELLADCPKLDGMITEEERSRLTELSLVLNDWENLREVFLQRGVVKANPIDKRNKGMKQRWTRVSSITGKPLSATERQLVKAWDKKRKEKDKGWMIENRMILEKFWGCAFRCAE